ncbi:MAG: LD-carboxypeptidase [Clostridium sp.]|nr:LD-carboxypeptidase [Prevotella sp.]MCM1428498.1 LD-carboxypeptidase [Clostridium sp.]MCM1475872.1 LD-carboxypeptidase [Muribaculaceae bacterium]
MFGKNKWIRPAALQPGDTVALISPATKVKPEYVEGAGAFIEKLGYRPMVMPRANGESSGSFSASLADRLADFNMALTNPNVKCIFCCRGGYGVQQLLPSVDSDLIRENAKWIVGFSDISAFLAAWAKANVMSLHGPMAKHITTKGNDLYTQEEFNILAGNEGDYKISVDPSPLNIEGKGSGRIIGGNLAVLNGLAATRWDPFNVKDADDYIYFIEDTGENIYEVDRILTRLYMTGALTKCQGLIVGEFSGYVEDLNYKTMEDMISARLKTMGVTIPTAFGFPVGHGDANMPIIIGAEAKLKVESKKVVLEYK